MSENAGTTPVPVCDNHYDCSECEAYITYAEQRAEEAVREEMRQPMACGHAKANLRETSDEQSRVGMPVNVCRVCEGLAAFRKAGDEMAGAIERAVCGPSRDLDTLTTYEARAWRKATGREK